PQWWIAPGCAMFLGNISDTLAFFFIAFYKSPDAFMAQHWVEIALVDYSFKVLICMVFFLPAYGVLLNAALKRLAERQTARQVNFG
ncbi:queuosine precursor transporter, partial [Pantoea agglomerans]|nr:queuosine precursor transporter [Pantoea agglomerans]